MDMWTIYDHPKDYPHGYLARRWWVNKGGEPEPLMDVIIAGLDDLREQFTREGRVCFQRNEGDDPVIVETWM